MTQAATFADAAWAEIEKPRPTSRQRRRSDDGEDCDGPIETGAFYLCAESKIWKPFRTKLPVWKALGVIRFNDEDNNWMWTTGRQIGWVPTIEEAKSKVDGKVI